MVRWGFWNRTHNLARMSLGDLHAVEAVPLEPFDLESTDVERFSEVVPA